MRYRCSSVGIVKYDVVDFGTGRLVWKLLVELLKSLLTGHVLVYADMLLLVNRESEFNFHFLFLFNVKMDAPTRRRREEEGSGTDGV